ncbi:MAG: hypothetical protein KIT45_00350 [Fimbriimonadia bacterium]|nr:hypothetical protein [Fimbriimonadia bacterium]
MLSRFSERRLLAVMMLSLGLNMTELQANRIDILEPKAGETVGWGAKRPDVRFDAVANLSQQVDRVFITAVLTNMMTGAIDRVPLFDDGTHGDTNANDRSFTNTFTVKDAGDFQLHFKMEWDINGKRSTKHSAKQMLHIVLMPYVQILGKRPGVVPSVSSSHAVDVAVLTGPHGEPLNPVPKDFRLKVWSNPAEKAVNIPTVIEAENKVVLHFENPGEHEIFIQGEMLQGGIWVPSETDTLKVQFNQPSRWWWVFGVLLALSYVFFPGKPLKAFKIVVDNKESKTIKKNETICIFNKNNDCTHHIVTVKLDKEVILQVDKKGKLSLKEGVLKKMVTPTPVELKKNDELNVNTKYRLNNGSTLSIEEPGNDFKEQTSRFFPNTGIKIVFLLMGACLAGYYVFSRYSMGGF